jgi:DNA replication and repair protein RecF
MGRVRLRHLWLSDFRNYERVELVPATGLTVVVGANGEGKTNLLEAVGWLTSLSSFRGAPGEALVRRGATSAVVRAEVTVEDETGGERSVLVEAELPRSGRDRVLLNRQPVRRARDALGVLRATVFTPDDLGVVKGGPAERRRFLDELLVASAPRHHATRADLDRVLRQRNTLLRQSGGRAIAEVVATLDVWDERLVEVGEVLGRARARLVERLAPTVGEAYGRVAGAPTTIGLAYEAPWREQGLAEALRTARADDLRRGLTTVGPHRDELLLEVGGAPARVFASQGEQRSLALALRLASHRLVTEVTGATPLLLLDDVFSELDSSRSQALVHCLPPAQTILTTAGALPTEATPDLVVRVRNGSLLAAA